MILFTIIVALRGKVNFRNLSRYSEVSARTYARQFDQLFDFIGLVSAANAGLGPQISRR